MNRNNLLLLAVMFIFITWTIGCSGGASNAPVFPEGGNPNPEADLDLEPITAKPLTLPGRGGDGVSARVPLGLYTFVADPAMGTLEIEEARTAQMHLNGVPLLESGPMQLLTLASPPVFSNGGQQLDVDIMIRHPNTDPTFTVFDVHGVLITIGTITGWNDVELKTAGPDDTRLMNPDGTTRWWNPKEFTNYGQFGYTPGKLGGPITGDTAATLNGYKTFADGLTPMSDLGDLDPALRSMFSSNSQCTRHYTMYLGGGLLFNYAVDASWASPTSKPPTPPDDFPQKANMTEPYWIEIDEWVNTLWWEMWEGYGGNVFYNITIHDWQGKDTIGSVRIEIPTLGIDDSLWDLKEEGPNYKKYEYRVVMPLLEANEDLDVLISVDSTNGSYQPVLTGVNKPLRAYMLHSTEVADGDPIFNVIPVCIMYATTPTDILKDQSVTFNAADSYDPDGDIIDYIWDFNGDGYYGDPWTSGTASNPTKQFTEFGNYVVRCQVEDNNHAKVISSPILINVASDDNLMPFAVAEATTETTIMSDETVTFDASESYDIDGEIAAYTWDFNGDGTYGDPFDSGTEVNPTVSWPAGEYDVDLKVIDNEAGWGILIEKIHVSVGNYPPVADAVATTSTEIVSGESVSFDASGSYDVDGDISAYEWDFDADGIYGDSYESGDDITPTKVYPEPGDFTVDLRVTDNLNAKDTIDLVIPITVTNPPPVADAVAVTPTNILKNETIEFDATGSYDPNGTIILYEWDFDGDGSYGDTYDSGTDTNPIKAYTMAGNFNVDLRVVDNNGAEDFLDVTIPVSVSNNPPVADASFNLGPPYYINVWYDLLGNNSYDPDGSIVEWAWDVDYDGATFTPTLYGEEIQAYWDAEAEYDIMLRVTDDDSATDMLDAPIHIEILWSDNQPPVVDSIEMSRTTTLWGSPLEAITFTCTAHDPNVGDTLSYEWTGPAGGSFDVDDEAVVVWTSPHEVGKVTVTCRVYDDFGAWDEMDSDLIRVTQYPTALSQAPEALMWTLETVFDTSTYSLADYTGNVVYMNFWQTS